jgi:hypothetical protein
VDRVSGMDALIHDADENDPHGDAAALFAEDWLDRYVDEESLFSSKLVFCELKTQELFKLTGKLPQPNPFRTWISADLLSKLISTIAEPRAQQFRAIGVLVCIQALLTSVFCRVLQKLFDVILAGVYTDEATDRGLLLTHAVKGMSNHSVLRAMTCVTAARKLERDLGLTAIKHSNSKTHMAEVQLAWKRGQLLLSVARRPEHFSFV